MSCAHHGNEPVGSTVFKILELDKVVEGGRLVDSFQKVLDGYEVSSLQRNVENRVYWA